jgi:hypothetical protein
MNGQDVLPIWKQTIILTVQQMKLNEDVVPLKRWLDPFLSTNLLQKRDPRNWPKQNSKPYRQVFVVSLKDAIQCGVDPKELGIFVRTLFESASSDDLLSSSSHFTSKASDFSRKLLDCGTKRDNDPTTSPILQQTFRPIAAADSLMVLHNPPDVVGVDVSPIHPSRFKMKLIAKKMKNLKDRSVQLSTKKMMKADFSSNHSRMKPLSQTSSSKITSAVVSVSDEQEDHDDNDDHPDDVDYESETEIFPDSPAAVPEKSSTTKRIPNMGQRAKIPMAQITHPDLERLKNALKSFEKTHFRSESQANMTCSTLGRLLHFSSSLQGFKDVSTYKTLDTMLDKILKSQTAVLAYVETYSSWTQRSSTVRNEVNHVRDLIRWRMSTLTMHEADDPSRRTLQIISDMLSIVQSRANRSIEIKSSVQLTQMGMWSSLQVLRDCLFKAVGEFDDAHGGFDLKSDVEVSVALEFQSLVVISLFVLNRPQRTSVISSLTVRDVCSEDGIVQVGKFKTRSTYHHLEFRISYYSAKLVERFVRQYRFKICGPIQSNLEEELLFTSQTSSKRNVSADVSSFFWEKLQLVLSPNRIRQIYRTEIAENPSLTRDDIKTMDSADAHSESVVHKHYNRKQDRRMISSKADDLYFECFPEPDLLNQRDEEEEGDEDNLIATDALALDDEDDNDKMDTEEDGLLTLRDGVKEMEQDCDPPFVQAEDTTRGERQGVIHSENGFESRSDLMKALMNNFDDDELLSILKNSTKARKQSTP